MNYTKGEWVIYPSALDAKDLAIWCAGQYIGTVRNKANAHLIAAAPDMYQKGQQALDWMHNQLVTANEITDFDRQVYDELAQALAKAKPETVLRGSLAKATDEGGRK